MNKIDAKHVNFFYGDFQALKDISMTIEEKSVVAFIGPSGCGKSTFLRLFNRKIGRASCRERVYVLV